MEIPLPDYVRDQLSRGTRDGDSQETDLERQFMKAGNPDR
jgi:hypothetical protein